MLRPRMVMEPLCSETDMKFTNIMSDLFASDKIQSLSFSSVSRKVVAIAEIDPREVMLKVRNLCRLIRVDWVDDPRLKQIKDPSEKWWVDPVEDLRQKWYDNIRNCKFVDPAEDPRNNNKWARRMEMEMLSCDTDEWFKALRAKRRFEDKIYYTKLDRDLKKLFLIVDMDPYEVMCCLHPYCRLLTVEWRRNRGQRVVHRDGNRKILIPSLGEVDEGEEKREILHEIDCDTVEDYATSN